MRTATLDFYAPDRARTAEEAPVEIVPARPSSRALDAIVPPGARLERVAGGFEFTEGPVWTRDGALLFSSPNTNTLYRWAPPGTSSGSNRTATSPCWPTSMPASG